MLREAQRHGQDSQVMQQVWDSVAPELRTLRPDRHGVVRITRRQLLRLEATIAQPHMAWADRCARLDALNRILYRLKAVDLVHSKYLNVPAQLERDLVVPLHRIRATELRTAMNMCRALASSSIPDPPAPWGHGPALWYFCGLVATATLTNYILLPRLPWHVANTRHEDFQLRRWIQFRQPVRDPRPQARIALVGKPSIRYPMIPATRRWLQALEQAIPDASRHERNVYRFPASWRAPEWLKTQFQPAWVQFVETFVRSADIQEQWRRFSRFQTYGAMLAILEGIPPFIVSWATGAVASHPMTIQSYLRLFHGKRPPAQPRFRALQSPRAQVYTRRRPRLPEEHLFSRIEAIRLALRRKDSPKRRKQLADAIQSELNRSPRPYPSRSAGSPQHLERNARYYGEWVSHLLSTPRFGPSTVETYASAVASEFPAYFGQSDLARWDKEDWINATGGCMADHETKNATTAFTQFQAFLVRKKWVKPENVRGVSRAAEFARPVLATPVPLVGWQDFLRTLDICKTLTTSERLNEYVRNFVILGFLGGLRGSEAAWLRFRDFHRFADWLIEIRNTKTQAGVRDLAVRPLIPKELLGQFVEWIHFQEPRDRSGPDAFVFPWFRLEGSRTLRDARKTPYSSSRLAALAGQALRMAIGEPVCFHQLRHGFASWFLLRWLVASGILKRSYHRWGKWPLFSQSHLAALRGLVFGFDDLAREESWPNRPCAPIRRGHAEFSHALMVLTRLLGHANPRTTLGTYCHTTDVLLDLLLRRRRDRDADETWTSRAQRTRRPHVTPQPIW